MRSGILAAATAAIAICVASAHADQLVLGFEGNLNSSFPSGAAFITKNGIDTLNSGANPLQYTATGATQGATAARFRTPATFTDGLELTEGGGVTELRNAYNSNTRFLVDVTVPQQPNQPAGAFPYVVLSYYINSDGTGGSFRRSPNLKILSGPNAGNDNAYNSGTVTMYFDYAAGATPLLYPADSAGPAGFTQLGFTFNAGNYDGAAAGGPLIVHLDNIRFVSVPEPTTLGVLAAVGGMMARRRR